MTAVTLDVKNLRKTLKQATRVLGQLSSSPVVLRVTNGNLAIMARDSEVAVTLRVQGLSATEGVSHERSAVVSARQMLATLGGLTSKRITLFLPEDHVAVEADGARRIVPHLSDLPDLPDLLDLTDLTDLPKPTDLPALTFRVDLRDLAKAFDHCASCTAACRPEYDAVYLFADVDRLRVMGTDSFRLCEHKMMAHYCMSGVSSAAISPKAARLASEILSDDIINIAITDRHVAFKSRSADVIANQLSVAPLPYESFLSAEVSTSLFINADKLREALVRAARVAGDIPTVLSVSDHNLTVLVQHRATSMRSEVEISRLLGITKRIVAVNARSFHEILKYVDGNIEVLLGKTAEHPIVIRARNFVGIVSPMYIKDIINQDAIVSHDHGI